MDIAVNDHIRLSEFRPSDGPALVQHLAEKEIYDRTLRIPYPYTEADASEWLTKIVPQMMRQQGRPVTWAIRDANDLLIGGCGFDGFQVGKSHCAEIGYWLAKPFWGRSIMPAVVERACRYGYAEFGLAKIVAHVFATNAGSMRVLEKCGFVQEGYLRKHYLKDGKFIDARLFAHFNEA